MNLVEFLKDEKVIIYYFEKQNSIKPCYCKVIKEIDNNFILVEENTGKGLLLNKLFISSIEKYSG
jgi:hypothetical protein